MILKLPNKFIFLHITFILVCIVAFHFIGGKATLVSPLFDLYILLLLSYSLFCTKGLSRESVYRLLVVSAFFLIYIIQYFFYNDGGYIDYFEFFRSIRFVVYLLVFMLMVDLWQNSINNRGVNNVNFESLLKLLLTLFLSFYIFQILILGEDRPKLYSENNYEIPSLLCFFSIVQYHRKSESKILALFSYICSLISLSKSGLLEAIFVYLKSKTAKLNIVNIFFLLIVSVIALFVIYYVFSLRTGEQDINDMDRVQFLFIFIELVSEFEFSELLFGKGVANELPISACIDLMYWANAISGDFAYCNATVFHSFILKLFYEFGLLGTILTLFCWYYYLTKSYGGILGRTLFFIVFICSISVSGFSNSIVIWPLFLGLIVKFFSKSDSLDGLSNSRVVRF